MPKRVDAAKIDPFAPGTPPILPISVVAAFLGLTTRVARKAALANELPAVVIDGQPYVLREPLRRLLYGDSPQPQPAHPLVPPEEAPM